VCHAIGESEHPLAGDGYLLRSGYRHALRCRLLLKVYHVVFSHI
jgi:hypothetical protein